MTNFKKRGQSLIDEISENLKRTIKKYNEIDKEELNNSDYMQKELRDREFSIDSKLKNELVHKNLFKEKNTASPKLDNLTLKSKVTKFQTDLENISKNVKNDFENLEDLIGKVEKELENLLKISS